MKFKYEDLHDSILNGEDNEEIGLYIEEDEDWTQDGKYQSKLTIFSYNGKYYRIEQTRSGSPFTEWHYEDLDVDKDGFIECEEVYKIPLIRTEWSDIPKKSHIEDLEERLSIAEDLLGEAHSIMNDVHLYNSEIYKEIGNFLYGEDEE